MDAEDGTGPAPGRAEAVEVGWRSWSSLLLAGGIMLLYLMAQGVLMGLLATLEVAVRGGVNAGAIAGGDLGAAVRAALQRHAGLYFSLATLAAAPLVWLACLGAARAGTPSRAPREARRAAVLRFLGLTRPRWRRAVPWLLATAAILAVYETASRLLDRPVLPDFMVDFLRTTPWPWLLAAAVVLGAPLVEEVVFRGLLLPGLAAGRLGAPGAVVLTARCGRSSTASTTSST